MEGSDVTDDQNYTQIHRIVLELSMMTLEEEIIRHPESIHAVDAFGRTPLIWAAARANEHYVTLLLDAGLTLMLWIRNRQVQYNILQDVTILSASACCSKLVPSLIPLYPVASK